MLMKDLIKNGGDEQKAYFSNYWGLRQENFSRELQNIHTKYFAK